MAGFSRLVARPSSRIPPVQFQLSQRKICIWQSDTGTGFSPSASVLPCQYNFTNSPNSYASTRCCYQKHCPPPPKPKLNIYRFCRHDYMKGLTWFILQPKSATETCWWLVHWNIGKYNKTLRICRFFFIFQLVLIFSVTRWRFGGFEMIFIAKLKKKNINYI